LHSSVYYFFFCARSPLSGLTDFGASELQSNRESNLQVADMTEPSKPRKALVHYLPQKPLSRTPGWMMSPAIAWR
jgi:hypothetical protein